MVKDISIKARHGKAVKLSCTFKGSVQEYALAWLNLSNNAREYPDAFLKVSNNSGCGVFVITPEKYVAKMKEFLNGFNSSVFKVEIWDEESVPTITPMVDWSANDFSKVDWDELERIEVLPYADAD